MGILDDAIRQHLELKRRTGAAADDELARLEDEAFGPPTRPGEPDFPSAEAPVETPASADAQPSSELEQGELAAGPAGVAEPEAAPDEPASPAAVVAEPSRAPGPEGPEQPSETPPRTGSDESPEPSASEAEAGQAGLYDHSESGEVELEELDLELDDEFSELGELETAEPPVSSLDTVEHPASIESLDTVEHTVEKAGDADAGPDKAPAGGGEEALEGEDVLEETPEFLRDQPEDDELWFEQGEPKDFDF